jgi:hypothetical protein
MNTTERVPILSGEWYDKFALEVEFESKDMFLKIMETLTRIGVSANRGQTVIQSCHIYHKRGLYYIVHFKELFALDGRSVNLLKDDIGRRNTIACLLEEWGMLTILDQDRVMEHRLPVSEIKIIKYQDKESYKLVSKYQIGTKKGNY